MDESALHYVNYCALLFFSFKESVYPFFMLLACIFSLFHLQRYNLIWFNQNITE